MKIVYVLPIYRSVPICSPRQNRIIAKGDYLKMQIEKYIPQSVLEENPYVDMLIYNVMEQSEAKILKAFVKGYQAGKNSKK